jgi:hypothetical protein
MAIAIAAALSLLGLTVGLPPWWQPIAAVANGLVLSGAIGALALDVFEMLRPRLGKPAYSIGAEIAVQVTSLLIGAALLALVSLALTATGLTRLLAMASPSPLSVMPTSSAVSSGAPSPSRLAGKAKPSEGSPSSPLSSTEAASVPETGVPSGSPYVADFGLWPTGSDWRHVGSLLVSRETSNEVLILAPATPSGPDYRVEAEIRVDGTTYGEANFGLVLRYENDLSYVFGVSHYGFGTDLSIRNGLDQIAGTDYDPGDSWHTYRAEARGNELILTVDGGKSVRVSNSDHFASGSVGLVTLQTGLTVRKFSVDLLPPPP